MTDEEKIALIRRVQQQAIERLHRQLEEELFRVPVSYVPSPPLTRRERVYYWGRAYLAGWRRALISLKRAACAQELDDD